MIFIEYITDIKIVYQQNMTRLTTQHSHKALNGAREYLTWYLYVFCLMIIMWESRISHTVTFFWCSWIISWTHAYRTWHIMHLNPSAVARWRKLDLASQYATMSKVKCRWRGIGQKLAFLAAKSWGAPTCRILHYKCFKWLQ